MPSNNRRTDPAWFVGCSQTKSGRAGLVPEPVAEDEEKFLSATGEWKYPTTTTVSTVAQLRTLTPEDLNTKYIRLLGYYAPGDGGGGVLYTDPADTTSADDGGSVFVINGIRVKADLHDIDVKRFGAKGDNVADDTAAVLAALAFQQNSALGGKLYFPEGRYRITSTIANGSHLLNLEGVGSGPTNGSKSATRIVMVTDNIPIIQLSGARNTIRGVILEYANYQTSANTNAKCIELLTYTHESWIEDVVLRRGAYGIYDAPTSLVWNCGLHRIWVTGYSNSGIYLGGPGTTWSMDHIYIQNLEVNPATPSVCNIQSISRSGVTLTITCDVLPPLLVPGMMVLVTNLAPSQYNVAYFVKTVSGNQITVDMVADPGVDPTDAVGTLQMPAQGATGPCLHLGYAWEGSIGALDVEHCITSYDAAIETNGTVTIGSLHLEALYSTQPSFRVIDNEGPALSIGTIHWINSGARAGQTMALVAARGTGGVVSFGAVGARDLWSTSAAVVGGTVGPATVVGWYVIASGRAGVSGLPTDFGTLRHPDGRLLAAQTITGTSGIKTGYDYTQTVNGSGTLGYDAYRFNVIPTAEGSGVGNLAAFRYNGVDRFTMRKDGLFTVLGPNGYSGHIIYMNPNPTAGGIQVYPSGPASSIFSPTGDAAKSTIVLSYGLAADRRLQLTHNSLQVSDNATGLVGQAFNINVGLGGTVTLGNVNSVVNLPAGAVAGTITGSSGTGVGLNFNETINGSGTLAYNAYQFDVTPTAEGSGTGQLAVFKYGAVDRFTLRKDGLVTVLGPSGYAGHIVYLTPVSGGIQVYPVGAGSSVFNASGNSNASIQLAYGSAVDRRMVIGANNISVFDNLTGASAFTLALNSNGGSVVVGSSTIDPSAAFQINSTTKAFLPPRMTKTERNAIGSPANGSVIYQTDNTPGLRTYEAGAWVRYTAIADP